MGEQKEINNTKFTALIKPHILNYLAFDFRIRLATNVISKQFNGSPEEMLMFAVIKRAIVDSASKTIDEDDILSAKSFLKGQMMPAEVCGVSSEWIRNTLKKFNVDSCLYTIHCDDAI